MHFRKRSLTILAPVLALVFAACGKPSNQRSYHLHGQVQSLTPDTQEAMVKNDEIKGFMPAMTMPYRFKSKTEFNSVKPGDVIDGTLVIASNDAYLTDVKKTGEAPLPKPEPTAAPIVTGPPMLKPGEEVPDASFVDQNGRARKFSSFHGSTVVLTFIYTNCPLPNYCPLMDRHFATIQEQLENDPSLSHVHLVTMSFDPRRDTPAVLLKHAHDLKADLKRWTFLTGKEKTIDTFAGHFGVFVARDATDPNIITHNLRTAIIGPDGKVIRLYAGNEWTPEEVLAVLKPTANAN